MKKVPSSLKKQCRHRLLGSFSSRDYIIIAHDFRGLREEHCNLHRALGQHEAAAETFQNREVQVQAKVEKVLMENAQLRAQLSEAKQKLESEVGRCGEQYH